MSKELAKENFWNWFNSNKNALEEFIQDPERDYTIYHQLTDELQKFSELLYPEITINEKDQFVLIITPNGITDGIEPTREIVAAAPAVNGWEIIRFRQPRDEVSLEFDGVFYESSDIEIIPELDEARDKVNIILFIRNMDKDPKNYQTLAFLYMDHILGEFNSITKVGYIDFKHLDPDESVEGSINLLELRKLIEENLY